MAQKIDAAAAHGVDHFIFDWYWYNETSTNGQPGLFQVILPTACGVSNEGGRSPLLALLPAVSWPWVPAWGSLEPSRRGGENAQKTGKNGAKMGEIRPKTGEGVGITWTGSQKSFVA